MGKATVYLEFAKDCIELAKLMGPDDAPKLIEVARAWRRLAEEEAAKESTIIGGSGTASAKAN